jgi:hypothetical protein
MDFTASDETMKWIRLWCERLTSPRSDTWQELGESWELYTKLMCFAGTCEQHGIIAVPGTELGYSDSQLAAMCRMPQDRFDAQLKHLLSLPDKVKRLTCDRLEMVDWAGYQTPYDKQIELGYRTKLHPKVTPQKSEVRSQKSEEQKSEKDRKSAPVSPDAPPGDKPQDPPARTFTQECVDRALISYEKRYCKTRQLTGYPGGQPALAKSYGLVVKTLAGFSPDFPKTKAATAAKTPEELKHVASVVQVAWVGYLERAEEIDTLAAKIPGKDGTWLRFPPTIAQFCGRIPQLSQSDVDAAARRVADIAEARKNAKRHNPDSGPSIRCGDKENVIP